MGVYINDLIITSDNNNDIHEFKGQMMNIFQMSYLGAPRYYLNIEVHQSPNDIKLGQSAYMLKILEKAGLVDCNPYQTPMEVHLKLSKSSTFPPVDDTLYRSLVESLRYLVDTQPDLAYSIGYSSHFMETPREEHLVTIKRILRYVAGTRTLGVLYTPEKKSVWHVCWATATVTWPRH